MGRNPLITVLMPVYNVEEYIEDALKSILSQTYTNYKVVIIDDGSTDNTADRIKPFLHDSRLKYLYQQNSGASSARNKGILESSGEWIALLDADDAWRADKLEKQVALINEDDNISFVFSNGMEFDDTGDVGPFYRERRKFPEGDVLPRLLCANCFWASSVMIKREDMIRVGLFRGDLLAATDYDMWVKILQLGGKAAGIWEPVTRYCIRGGSISRKKIPVYESLVSIYADAITRTNNDEHLVILKESLARTKSNLLLAKARVLLDREGQSFSFRRLLYLAWREYPKRVKPLGWLILSLLGCNKNVSKALAKRW